MKSRINISYFVAIIVFSFLALFSLNVSAKEGYTYGNISWSDGKKVVKKKMMTGEYKYYAQQEVDEFLIRDILDNSVSVKDEFKIIQKCIVNKLGNKQIVVIGFSGTNLHGQVHPTFTPAVFLFSKDDKLITQKYKNLSNVELIKKSLIKKYGEPKKSDIVMIENFVWETGERIVQLTTMMESGEILYINKSILSQTVDFLKQEYGDLSKEKGQNAKEEANKF